MERLTKRNENGTAIYNMPSGTAIKLENNRHEVLQKLAEYEDLEEQRRLIKLPCPAGKKVSLLRKDIKEVIDGEITSFEITECTCGMEVFITDDNRYTYITFDKIGDIVFFTQTEAEAALEKILK